MFKTQIYINFDIWHQPKQNSFLCKMKFFYVKQNIPNLQWMELYHKTFFL